MNRQMKLSFILLVVLIVGAHHLSRGQGSIMWRMPITQVPLANVGTAGGQYYDPQYAPLDNDWLSFEVDREGARALYVLDLKHQQRYEIAIGKNSSANQNMFEQSNAPANAFAGELSWCPAKFDGKQWFAFVGS